MLRIAPIPALFLGSCICGAAQEYPGLLIRREEGKGLFPAAGCREHGPVTKGQYLCLIFLRENGDRHTKQCRQSLFPGVWNGFIAMLPGTEHLAGYADFPGSHALRVIASGADMINSCFHGDSSLPDKRLSWIHRTKG